MPDSGVMFRQRHHRWNDGAPSCRVQRRSPAPAARVVGVVLTPAAWQLPDRLRAAGPGWHPLLQLHEQLLTSVLEVPGGQCHLRVLWQSRMPQNLRDRAGGWMKAVCDNCCQAWSSRALIVLGGALHRRQPG